MDTYVVCIGNIFYFFSPLFFVGAILPGPSQTESLLATEF